MDGVLLTIPISMIDADHGDDAQIHAEQHQGDQRTNAGRRQARQMVSGWTKFS